MPDDWPNCYDLWDAYDGEGEFLFTLNYQALGKLLDGETFDHEVVLQFEGKPDEDVVVWPEHSFDLTLRIVLEGDVVVENPDHLVSKAELWEMVAAMFKDP